MSDNYLVQDCDISLKEALNRYYAQNPGFYQPSQLDDDSRKLFFAHDVCHIVFGCDTSLVGESKLEQWILNSTDLNLKNYADAILSTEATRQAVSEISIWQILTQGFFNIFTLVKTYFWARQVQPKWDFYNYSSHLDRRILDIRKEFNIQVV
jgi:ubiquinone biosynthesis protein Coq4